MKLVLVFEVEVDENEIADYKTRFPDLAANETAGAILVREALSCWGWEGIASGHGIYTTGSLDRIETIETFDNSCDHHSNEDCMPWRMCGNCDESLNNSECLCLMYRVGRGVR